MPLDRVFALPGAGVVVTGTAWSGTVRAGDTLRLLPQDRELRVREVQNHGSAANEAGAGEPGRDIRHRAYQLHPGTEAQRANPPRE